jgi:hypothetical protein
MAVDLQQDAGGKILAIKLTGKLTKEDYEHFVPTRVVCVTSTRRIARAADCGSMDGSESLPRGTSLIH